jgi:hypothetical protein
MKKCSIILTIAIIFSTLFSFTYADTNQANTTTQNVSISFKIGDEILKINGNEVKVVKPYAVNGNTLVPLRVITEAFGADVKWEPSDNSITITYSNVSIRLILKNTEAVINGQKINMAVAPVAINGTTMVPLRFITENFGAEVSFNNDTKEIIVTKELVSDDSITDFSELLKRSTKERIGDSYYNWSVELPAGFDLYSRSSTGNTIVFSTPDENKYLYISIANRTNETLDYIWQNEALAIMAANETILENKILDISGTQFNRIVYKDDEGIYERRVYISGDKIYSLGFGVYDNSLKNTDDYKKILDSFKLTFTDEAITEDFADVDSDGYRVYNSEDLGFTFKVPAEWTEWDNGKENSITYYDVNSSNSLLFNELTFNMYSKGSILTLNDWVAKQKQIIADEYNTSLVKLIDEERINVNGVDCATLTKTVRYNNELVYYIDAFLVGENYRYQLSIMMSAEDYNNTAYKAKIDTILNSIEISEPNVSDVGSLYDPIEVLTQNKLYEVTGTANQWSFKVPMSWSKVITSYPNTEFLYKDIYSEIMFAFLSRSESNAKLIEFYEEVVDDAEKTGNFKNIDKEVLYEKGATIYKYTNSIISEDSTQTEYYYIIDKNGKSYVTYFIIDNIRKSDKNLKLIEDMWNSITLN